MQNTRHVGVHLLSAASALALAIAAPQVSLAAEAAPGATTLEDVIVTAQRREERLQDVPIAVTAITSTALAARGLTGNEELVQATPSLNIGRSGSTPLLYLRGVGNQSGSPGSEPSVPLYIDGVVVFGQNVTLNSFNNVERVEVLRGPQGTLFGRNATGGLIQIITRDPSHTPGGEARIGYGNYNTVEGSFYGTTPLSDTLATNLAAYYKKRSDGFGTNIFNGHDVYKTEEYAVRSKLLWTPTDTTRVTLTGDYTFNNSDVGLVRVFPPGIVALDGRTRRAGGYYDINHNLDPKSVTTRASGVLRVEQDLGAARILSITAYQKETDKWSLDLDGTPSTIVHSYTHDKNAGWTQELQLQSPVDSRIQWVLGGFYLNSRVKQDPQQIYGAVAGAAGFLRRHGSVKTFSYSGFGQATVPVTDTTKLTAGVRWTHDEKDLKQATDTALGAGAYRFDVLKNSKLTYRFVIDQKLQEGMMAYASVSRGYKSGEFNLTNPANPSIQPEVLDAYEAGLKSEFLDRRVRLNLSGFYYNYKNLQLSQQLGAATLVLNAAKARIYGAEAELQAAVTNELTVSGNLSLLHGRYRDFPGAPFSFNHPFAGRPGLTCPGLANPDTAIAGNAQCFGDASGNKTVRTPPVAIGLAANYVTPLANGKLGVNVAWSYTGRFYFETDNRLTQKAYSVANGDVSWTDPSDRYVIRAWIKNAFDKHYATVASASTADQYGYAEPRTFGADLTVRF